MAHGAHVNPRVCRGLDVDVLVYKGNLVHVLGASFIDEGVFSRWVFIFRGFTIDSSPWLGIFFIIW